MKRVAILLGTVIAMLLYMAVPAFASAQQVNFTQDGVSGVCSALFNVSASGIVHEIREDCAPFAGEDDLKIMFRPIGLRPSSTCSATESGMPLLGWASNWSMTDNIGPDYTDIGGGGYHDSGGDAGNISDVFTSSSQTYNVCFYDGGPTVTIGNNPTAAEGSSLVYTVSLAHPAIGTVTVDIETDQSYSIATPGSDYTPGSATLTFAPGQTSKPFSVVTLDDNRDDINTGFNGEYVWAHITGVGGPVDLPADFTTNLATNDRWGLGVILDDEAAPTLSIDNPVTPEGSSLTYTLSLSHPSDYTISMATDTSEPYNNTADYTPKSETLVFSPGDTSETFVVATTNEVPAICEGPTGLGPGDGIWIHVDSITGGPVTAPDFVSNLATSDRWALGFIDDAADCVV